MSKRLLCILLTIIIMFSCLPTTVSADEEQKPVVIGVVADGYRRIEVYTKGDDLLISAENLAWMSGFELREENGFLYFTRGQKVVEIDTKAHTVGVKSVPKRMYMESPAKQVDGKWYLSGASVIPWLNTTCSAKNGMLRAVPNPVSLWDDMIDFSLDDYKFDFVESCEKIGVNSKQVQAAAYVKNNGLKMVLDLDLYGTGKTYLSTERYYKLFDDMIKDLSATDQSVKEWEDYLSASNLLIDTSALFAEPGMSTVLDWAGTAVDLAEEGLSYYVYLNLFENDNTQKLDMLQSLIDQREYGDNKNMLSAAQDIIYTYTNFWAGTLKKAGYTITDLSFDYINSKVVLDSVNLVWNSEKKVNEQIDRISPYNTIGKSGKRVFDRGYGIYSEETLRHAYNHAMLYLYGVEQNIRAMVAYSDSSGHGTAAVNSVNKANADAAEKAYSQFLNISLYTRYDSCDTETKEEMVEDTIELFKSLYIYEPVEGVAAMAENAICLEALKDSSYGDTVLWTVRDADEDGDDEVLAQLDSVATGWRDLFFTVDASNIAADIFDYGSRAFMATPMHGLVQSADGEKVYLESGYMTYFDQGQEYLEWTGRKWERLVCWYNTVTVQDNGEEIEEETWKVKGEEATENEYNEALAKLDISSTPFVLDNPDLSNQTVSGNVDKIFNELDAYFENRFGCVAQDKVDVNSDGNTDRIYAIYGAADLWMSGFERDYFQEDKYITLVVAEDNEESVNLRVCRLPQTAEELLGDKSLSLDTTFKDLYQFDDNKLIIGDYSYNYNPQGIVYGSNDELDLISILELTLFEAKNAVDKFSMFEDLEGYSTCYLDGNPMDLFFDSSNTDAEIDILRLYSEGNAVAIVPDITTDMTREQIWEGIQPSSSWSELIEYTDFDGNILGYMTSFSYQHPRTGVYYYVNIYFESKDSDAKIIQIEFLKVKGDSTHILLE